MSPALVFIKRGYDVRVFERQFECRAIGGAVLLSTPVLPILRSYGLKTVHFGSYTVTAFNSDKGRGRVKLPFNPAVERMMGIKGWHHGVLRSSLFKKILKLVPDFDDVVLPDHSFLFFFFTPSLKIILKSPSRMETT